MFVVVRGVEVCYCEPCLFEVFVVALLCALPPVLYAHDYMGVVRGNLVAVVLPC